MTSMYSNMNMMSLGAVQQHPKHFQQLCCFEFLFISHPLVFPHCKMMRFMVAFVAANNVIMTDNVIMADNIIAADNVVILPVFF